jgi:putrescine transport system substrate-binding protein
MTIKSGLLAVSALTGIATGASAQDQVVNIYNWADYFAEATLEAFEAETGIKVIYDTFDSNNVLETKLLAGGSGYDVVFPASNRIGNQIAAGAYQKLDKSKLTNLQNIDPQFMGVAGVNDPGNDHAVPYTWGTVGIFVDNQAVAARMPDAPIDSWEMIFNPDIVSKFADCGVFVLDSAREIVPAALTYLGKDPNSADPDDIEAAVKLLEPIRPFLTHFSNSRVINDIATGEMCLGVVYNGDVGLAYVRADEASKALDVTYSIPKEGTVVYLDTMMIPVDAPHPDAAHTFINYILRPDVIADITNYIYYANANEAANELINEGIRNDPGTYPSDTTRDKLFAIPNYAPKDLRGLNRAWTAFKKGG